MSNNPIISDSMYRGGHGDAPEYIKKAVPQKIIEWYSVEPDVQLCSFFYCLQAKRLIAIPCFWPHLILLTPIFCCKAYVNKNAAMHSTVVLTETSVNLIQESFNIACFPVGGTNSSIQIFQMSDVVIKEHPAFCCSPEVTSMNIVADNSSIVVNGSNQLQEFRTAVFKQQQIVGRKFTGNSVPEATIVATGTGSSGGESSFEKLTGLKKMLDDGLINQSEFDEQKKLILAKMSS